MDILEKISQHLSVEALQIVSDLDLRNESETLEDEYAAMKLGFELTKLDQLNFELELSEEKEKREIAELEKLQFDLSIHKREMLNSKKDFPVIDLKREKAKLVDLQAAHTDKKSNENDLDIPQLLKLFEEVEELKKKKSELEDKFHWAHGLPPTLSGAKGRIDELTKEIEQLKMLEAMQISEEVSTSRIKVEPDFFTPSFTKNIKEPDARQINEESLPSRIKVEPEFFTPSFKVNIKKEPDV